jgi:hypothetical protein
MVGFLLTVFGALLLLFSLSSVAFGVYMALDVRTRERGVFFTAWWIPAVATASGIMMRDRVTFVIGLFCFAVAGVALALELGVVEKPSTGRGKSSARVRNRPFYQEAKLRIFNKIREYRKIVS